MPSRASELTVRQLEAIKPPKPPSDLRKAVGGATGLCINIKPSGSRSWLFRYSFAGKRQTPIALGSYSRDVNSLSAMREVARGFNKLIKEGIDPKLHLKEKRNAALFKKAINADKLVAYASSRPMPAVTQSTATSLQSVPIW